MLHGLRAIDCDTHPMVPGMRALAPYLDEFWRDQVAERGITTLDSQSWPIRSPKTIRQDWRAEDGRGAEGVQALRDQALDRVNRQVAELAEMLALERGQATELRGTLTRTATELRAAAAASSKAWLGATGSPASRSASCP